MTTQISEISDTSLLRDYVAKGDEDAFAELVRRHLPLVYSAAARRLGQDPSAAQDIAQSVFLHLAGHARELLRHPVLAGWLYVTASRKAADHARNLARRQRRETMHAENTAPESPEPSWSALKPLLDDAMLDLADDDRNALVLRYFEGRDFAAVGQNLGVSADAARMRVGRGLEKLRALLKKKGVTGGAAALEALLLQEAVEAVPAGLAASIARAVRTAPAPEASAPLATSAAKALSAAAVLLLVTAVGTVALRSRHSKPSAPSAAPTASDPARKGPAVADPARFLRGRAQTRPQGAPVDPKVAQALGYLRSALFETALGRPERMRLLRESSEMLVGLEGETIPLFREAFASTDPEVLHLAIEGVGWFGPLPREFGPELLALLENPLLKEDVGLIANRLLPSMVAADDPVPTLLSLLERRPDLAGPLQYLLKGVIGFNQPQLAANRDLVGALLDSPNPELQQIAKSILADLPQPPPEPTPEVSGRLTAGLGSADPAERRKALDQALRLQSATPELREALAAVLRQDPSLQMRVDTRITLERLAPNDPALAAPPAPQREITTRELIAKFDRQQASVSEMLAVGVLASLHNERDPRVYEAVTETFARVNNFPRTTYPIEQLAPYFAAMESALTPGEYAIAMRDLKPSLESYWQARGFSQPEPTHLPANLVQTLMVGPLHDNRPAYDQMLRAIRQIDPAFQPPTQ